MSDKHKTSTAQAVVHLYQEHFLTFQMDPANVSNEWLRALESFALPLFQARLRKKNVSKVRLRKLLAERTNGYRV